MGCFGVPERCRMLWGVLKGLMETYARQVLNEISHITAPSKSWWGECLRGFRSGDEGHKGWEASGRVGGATWVVSCAGVPSVHCDFNVQDNQRPQYVRDGEADSAFTPVTYVAWTVPQFEPEYLSGSWLQCDTGHVEEIWHSSSDGWQRAFADRSVSKLQKEERLDTTKESLDYEALTFGNWSNKTYGKHVMRVRKEKFQKWTSRVGNSASTRTRCCIWYG